MTWIVKLGNSALFNQLLGGKEKERIELVHTFPDIKYSILFCFWLTLGTFDLLFNLHGD